MSTTFITRRRLAVAAAALSLLGATVTTPAQAVAAKNATASWTGSTGDTVAIGNKTGSCNGCTRYTLEKISGPSDLNFTPHYKRAIAADGTRYLVTKLWTTSDTAGVWVYRLTFHPGQRGKPTFSTTWTLTFQGLPMLDLPDQNYFVADSGGSLTLQDIKVRTNSPGARSYSVLDTDNTAGCTLNDVTSRVHFVRVGHCKVRVTVAASGIYRAASTVATINVLAGYTYSVTVYGWVQKTTFTHNDYTLSRARAYAVRRYLASQGIKVSKFKVVQGKGAKNRTNAARQATVIISWKGKTTGSRSTTVYFTPMSSRLSLFAKGRLNNLWRAVPRS